VPVMDSLKVLQVATSYPQFRNDVSGPFIHRFVKALERNETTKDLRKGVIRNK